VTSDVSNAVKAAKCGRIDFKVDKTAIVHVGLGKVNISLKPFIFADKKEKKKKQKVQQLMVVGLIFKQFMTG
jgi:ribosomal protein L1